MEAQFDFRFLSSGGTLLALDDGGGTSTVAFHFSDDCQTHDGTGIAPIELVFATAGIVGKDLGEEHDSSIYCVYANALGLSLGLTLPAASDNLQFTLNPPPYE